jgi:tight adherence protein B
MLIGLAAAFLVVDIRTRFEQQVVARRAQQQLGLRVGRRIERPEWFGRTDQMGLLALSATLGLVGVIILGPLGVIVAAVPTAVTTIRDRRQRRARSTALVIELGPALQLVIDNLRVGRDLISAFGEVAASAASPVDEILSTVVAETQLGGRVDVVIAKQAALEGDRHLMVVASAIGLHVEHGGNLVEILSGVVETIEEEDRLRRNIASLTADGRLSSSVLLALPVLTLIVVSVLSPGYASPLLTDPLGRAMSIAGLVLGAIGWFWLRRLANPDIVG